MAFHLRWTTEATMDDVDKAIDNAFRQLGHSSVKQEQREAARCVLLERDCLNCNCAYQVWQISHLLRATTVCFSAPRAFLWCQRMLPPALCHCDIASLIAHGRSSSET